MKKIKYCFLFLSALLLAIHASSATYQIPIYGGNLYSGDSAQTKTGLNFTIVADTKNLIISATFPELNKTFTLRNNSCEAALNISVCFRGTTFGYYNKTEPSDLGTYSIVYSNTVSIYSYRANIGLERQVFQNQFLVLEGTEIKATFKNSGDRTATNIHYSDYFPPDYFEITNITGDCRQDGGAVYWQGSLEITQEIICNYKLKALKPTTYLSKARLNYSDPEEKRMLESAEVELKVPEHPINITYSMESVRGGNVSSTLTGQDLLLKINFTNTAKTSYHIRYFTLNYERKEQTSYGTGKFNDTKTYFAGERLLANETRQYYYPIATEFSGEYNITLSAEYLENDLGKKVIVKVPLNVYIVPLSMIFVNSTSATKIHIQNPDHQDYYNITSEVFLKTLEKEFRTRDETKELKSGWSKETLTYPENLAKNFNLNISLRYETKYNELITANFSFGSFEEKKIEPPVQNISEIISIPANITQNITLNITTSEIINQTIIKNQTTNETTNQTAQPATANITQPQIQKERIILFGKGPLRLTAANIIFAIIIVLIGVIAVVLINLQSKKKIIKSK